MIGIEGIAWRACVLPQMEFHFAAENRLARPPSFVGPLARLARLLGAVGVLTLLTAGSAAACAICLSGWVVTIGQQLDLSDQAVLALADSDGQHFRIVEVVKGNGAAGRIITEPVLRADAETIQGGKPALLLWNALAQRWAGIGAIDADHAAWLRRLVATGGTDGSRSKPTWPKATQKPNALTDADWHERLAIVVPYLESPEPLAAEIAYGEMGRAPYGALRSVRLQLEAGKIASWVDDRKLASRRSTYTLLFGIAGGPSDAAVLEQRIDVAWKSRDATNLAAMLAADLELRGPARLDWIDQMYFADRNRTLPEIEAALLALGVQGGANGAVPRERVIQTYRSFMAERKPMAGFVAQQLADWEYWDATTDYVALLKSDVVKDPVSHFAIVNYLQRSPRPVAKLALQWLVEEPR
jgi:hypothetical protein